MSEILRLALFLVTLGLALTVSSRRTRTGVNLFIAWMLLFCFAPGIVGKDSWPFSRYPILAERAADDPIVEKVQIMVVDSVGREWITPPDVWDPFSAYDLTRQIWRSNESWSEVEKEAVARDLLARAREYGRAGPLVKTARLLEAPQPLRELARPLPEPEDIVGVRVYELKWRSRKSISSAGKVERRLLFETNEIDRRN